MTPEDLKALEEFKAKHPSWWFTIGVCDVSRDFTAAPQGRSPETARGFKPRSCWDNGFACDSHGTIADAIYDVMEQIDYADSIYPEEPKE